MDQFEDKSRDRLPNFPVPTVGAAGAANNEEAPDLELENALQNGAAASADRVSTDTDRVVAVLEDELAYTLTLPEAQQRILAADRKAPSDRSMQRYVNDPTHVLKGRKVSTTTGQEFLFNDISVDAFVATLPKILRVLSVPTAGAAGAAKLKTEDEKDENSGGADSADTVEGVTTGEETRTVGSVLVENGKLLGQLAGKDGIIDGKNEVIERQHKMIEFLQGEVIASREHRGEIKDLAKEVLGTLEVIATKKAVSPKEGSKRIPDIVEARVVSTVNNPAEEGGEAASD